MPDRHVNQNIAHARAAFPQHTALIVEKAGIAPKAAVSDGFTDCPPEFHARHTVSQRVADTAAVVDHLDLDGPTILLEGGLAVAMLTNRIATDAAIILSSGSGIAFDELVLLTVPPEGQEQVKAGFAAARENPEGLTLFAGSSHRFWADILQLKADDYMVQTDTPFLLIQGGLDASSPTEAARATANRFAAEGRCNLTYWELPAYDHGMRDPGGMSHMAAILKQAVTWTENVERGCATMQP